MTETTSRYDGSQYKDAPLAQAQPSSTAGTHDDRRPVPVMASGHQDGRRPHDDRR
ncbi:MAG TPA: hypothetical protein VGE23_01085 [Candidatus Paceibacterota bacterium]